MKHQKKRISKIVDELITYFLKIGCKNIKIDVLEDKKYYRIKFVTTIEKVKEKDLDLLKKCLDCDKIVEMEEYYWELTGESDTDTELSIVGMMTDDYDLSIKEKELQLIIYKYK